MPVTGFGVDDVKYIFDCLKKLGAAFKKSPVEMGLIKLAMFDDTWAM